MYRVCINFESVYTSYHNYIKYMNQESSQGVAAKPRLPGAFAVWSEAWDLYLSNLRLLVSIMLVPAVVSVILTKIFSLNAPIVVGPDGSSPLPANVSLVIFIITSFVGSWSSAAFLIAIRDRSIGPTFTEAYRKGWEKVWSYMWLGFLYGAIVMGGLLLLVIPGIFFFVSLGLSPYILIMEEERGMNALIKSRVYIKGYWWAIAGRLALVTLMLIAIVIAVSAFLTPINSYLTDIVTTSLVMPFIMVYGYVLYGHVKAVRGQVTFVPTRSEKINLSLVAALCLFIPMLAASVLASLSAARLQAEKNAHPVEEAPYSQQ